MEIKLREDFNREKELKEIEDLYNFKGNLSYNLTRSDLEDIRKRKIKELRELVTCIENMSIEEFDAYNDVTSCFEDQLSDIIDENFLNETIELFNKYYKEDSHIHHITTIGF